MINEFMDHFDDHQINMLLSSNNELVFEVNFFNLKAIIKDVFILEIKTLLFNNEEISEETFNKIIKLKAFY